MTTARAVVMATGLAWLVGAAPAGAAKIGLTVDASQSTIQLGGGAPSSLSGQIQLDVGGGAPPVALRTALTVTSLSLSGGGIDVGLDPDIAHAGLGFIDPDDQFQIPLLFVRVEDGAASIALTLLDVLGTFGPGASCGGALCLETSLEVDTGPVTGLATVQIVAVPEPGVAAFLAAAAAGLAVLRRRRAEEAGR